MGSIARGIPTGAPIATSPFETSAYFYAWSYEDDARDVYRDEEVIGGLQVRFGCYSLSYFCFLLFLIRI